MVQLNSTSTLAENVIIFNELNHPCCFRLLSFDENFASFIGDGLFLSL